MSRIDTTQRKKFKIGDFFDIVNGKKYPKQNREIGSLPLVSTSSVNNGISDYIKERDDSVYSNCLTVAYSGSVGYTAYQKNKFFLGETVIALIPKFNLNENIALFLVSILNKHNEEYTYNHKIKVLNYGTDEIRLPINNEGNPDREYMENYMKNLEEKCKGKLYNLKIIKEGAKNTIDVSEWKEFQVDKLLEMQHQIELSPIDAFNNNVPNDITYPFYGQSSENNGIIDFYYLGEDLLNNKDSANCIMIHSNTHLAYHVNTPFYLKDGHGATTIFTNDNLNELSVFFLIAVLNRTMARLFDYDTKATKEKLKNLVIKLPVDGNGNPDRNYMENYIKNIMEKNKEKLNCLT